MEFGSYGIDPRLAGAVGGDGGPHAASHGPMLEHAISSGENVCARLALTAGSGEVLLLPVFQQLLDMRTRRSAASGGLEGAADATGADEGAADATGAGDGAADALGAGGGAADALGADQGAAVKALLLVPDGQAGQDGVIPVAQRLAGAVGLAFSVLDTADDASVGAAGAADFLAATPAGFVAAAAAGRLDPAGYVLLAVSDADRIAESPPDILRALETTLPPSWKRKTCIACGKFTPKVRQLARSLAENPVEFVVDEQALLARGISQRTWHVPEASKIVFLLGLLEREGAGAACIFCNLAEGAGELARRLESNGVRALVLTDEGARGLPKGCHRLVVNFDIPLEPELYLARMAMLDREAPGASIVNIACDRYLYGIPAIERMTGASLGMVLAGRELLESTDRSAASGEADRLRGGRPANGKGRRRDERQSRHASGTRSPDSFDLADRTPDIRRIIAEATGGSLDVGGAAEPARVRREGRHAGKDSGGRPGRKPGAGRAGDTDPGAGFSAGMSAGDAGHAGKGNGRKGKTGSDHVREAGKVGGSAGGATQGGGKHHTGKKQGHTGHADGTGTERVAGDVNRDGGWVRRPKQGPGQARAGGANQAGRHEPGRNTDTRAGGLAAGPDPYSLTMEERLRLLKDRYAGKTGSSKRDAPGRKQRHRGGTGEAQSPAAAPGRGGRRADEARPSAGSSIEGKPSPAPGPAVRKPERGGEAPSAHGTASGDVPPESADGLLGRITGWFRKGKR